MDRWEVMGAAGSCEEVGRSQDNWKKGGQGGSMMKPRGGNGQGWMGVKGDSESGRGGWGDRSVSVKDETPKQVSKSQTDRIH